MKEQPIILKEKDAMPFAAQVLDVLVPYMRTFRRLGRERSHILELRALPDASKYRDVLNEECLELVNRCTLRELGIFLREMEDRLLMFGVNIRDGEGDSEAAGA